MLPEPFLMLAESRLERQHMNHLSLWAKVGEKHFGA